MTERGTDPIGYDADKFEGLLRDDPWGGPRPLVEKPGIDPGDALAALSICGLSGNYGAKGEPLACAYPRGHGGNHAWASLPTFTAVAALVPEVGLREAARNHVEAECQCRIGTHDASCALVTTEYALRAALAQSAPEAGGEDGR